MNTNISGNLYRFIQEKFTINNVKCALSHCLLCKGKCTNISLLCDICYHDLPTFKSHKNLLAQPKYARDISHEYIDNLICLAPYQWPLSSWINQLKYQQNFELSNLLSHILMQHIHDELLSLCSHSNTALMSVPIHISRWQARGYNQSHLLAKNIAKVYQYTYQPEAIIRIKSTEKQVGKSGSERRKNIKNAFMVNPSIPLYMPEHVILIDDVITTGTTANELARLCKQKGANKVTVITLALAIKNG